MKGFGVHEPVLTAAAPLQPSASRGTTALNGAALAGSSLPSPGPASLLPGWWDSAAPKVPQQQHPSHPNNMF